MKTGSPLFYCGSSECCPEGEWAFLLLQALFQERKCRAFMRTRSGNCFAGSMQRLFSVSLGKHCIKLVRKMRSQIFRQIA